MASRLCSRLWRASGPLVAAVLLAAPGLQAQETGTITGRVVDARSNQPVASVQVYISGLDLGVLTQQNGRYLLQNVPEGTHTLTAERIGYRTTTQEVTVGAGETVVQNFQVAEEALQLDEMIVTGTPGGTQRRAIGNAVSQVQASEVTERVAITNMQEMLSGRSSGLDFNRTPGQVGTGSEIRIRGISSLELDAQPLIYVDGIRVNNSLSTGPPIRSGLSANAEGSALDDINPNDIESIEIIKGPAAATLYGTEASAGVIQIITKKGESGAPQFNLSIRQGTNFMRDPAGRIGEAHFFNSETFEIESYNPYNAVVDSLGDPLQNGHTQGYNLSVRGGTDDVRYYLSGDWSDDEGWVSYNWSETLNLRGNVTVVMSDQFTLDVSTGYVTGETSLGQQLNEGGLWELMMWSRTPGELLRYSPSALETVEATRDYSRFTGSATLTHNFRDFLTQRLVIGLDHTSEENQQLVPRHPDGANGPFGNLSLGRVNLDRPFRSERSFDYSASADYALNDAISFTTSVGAQFYHSETNEVITTGQTFASPVLRSIAGATENINATQSFDENKSLGFYVQQELNYNDRAFITAAIRADDNSAFGANFDAQYYPKLSGTWVISEEPFWNVDFVNSLRLRTAWGQAGRQPSTFAAVTTFAPTNGPGGSAAVAPASAGNPDIGPEVATELEVGFDAALFEDRVSAEFTYYTQRVEDALLDVTLAPSEMIPGAEDANVGRMDNWGWEASLDARVFDQQSWAFDLGLSADHSMNEIKDLGPVNPTEDMREGLPFPIWTTTKIVSAEFDENGLPTNVMCDGGTGREGREIGGEPVPCDQLDFEHMVGTQFPTYTWAVDGTLTLFQDLQLFGLVEGEHGQWGYDFNVRCRHPRCYFNTELALTQADPVYYAGAVQWQTQPVDLTLDGLFDAAFVKLREVGLRYQLPETLVQRMGADRASLSLSGRNLATLWRAQEELSGARIPDPEVGTSGTSFALGAVPPLSSFSATVRVSF